MRADETSIEVLIADIRCRLGKQPRLIHVFELLLEHLEHVEVSASEQEKALGWLRYAVESPRMAELVYGMARLIQPEIEARKRVTRSAGN